MESAWEKCKLCSQYEDCDYIQLAVEAGDETLPEPQPCNHSPIEEWYTNVYRVGQTYGGREEGGWYYLTGEPVESILVGSKEAAQKRVEELRNSERYSNEGRRSIYSVLGSWEYQVYVEAHFARYFPEKRPHYE